MKSGTQALSDCDALCQTYKHHTRQGRRGRPPGRTSRISSVKSAPTGRVHVEIEPDCDAPGQRPKLDARGLAEQCVEDWRAFFARHRIGEPTC